MEVNPLEENVEKDFPFSQGLDYRADPLVPSSPQTVPQKNPQTISSSSSSSPNQENPTSASTAATPTAEPSTDEAMANFPVNPQAFLVAGLAVEHGWHRPARGRMALGGEPTREHEDYAILSINPMPQEVGALRPTLNVVCNFLEQEHRVRVIAPIFPLSVWV